MSIFDPRHTGSDAEPDAHRERQDAPLPTRFGRDGRRRRRPRPQSGADRPSGELAPEDERPFEDDGGL